MFTDNMEVLLAAYLGFEGLTLWKLSPRVPRDRTYSAVGLGEKGMRRRFACLRYAAYAVSHWCADFALRKSPILFPFVLTFALIDKPWAHGIAVFLTLAVIWGKAVSVGSYLFCFSWIQRNAVGDLPSPISIAGYDPIPEPPRPTPQKPSTPPPAAPAPNPAPIAPNPSRWTTATDGGPFRR